MGSFFFPPSLSINPFHPNISKYILHNFFLYVSFGTDKENVLNNQELHWLVIISFILLALMCDSGIYCKEKLDAGHSKRLNG